MFHRTAMTWIWLRSRWRCVVAGLTTADFPSPMPVKKAADWTWSDRSYPPRGDTRTPRAGPNVRGGSAQGRECVLQRHDGSACEEVIPRPYRVTTTATRSPRSRTQPRCCWNVSATRRPRSASTSRQTLPHLARATMEAAPRMEVSACRRTRLPRPDCSSREHG